MKRYEKEQIAEELAALPDSEIDYSDLPELDESFFERARLVMPNEERAHYNPPEKAHYRLFQEARPGVSVTH